MSYCTILSDVCEAINQIYKIHYIIHVQSDIHGFYTDLCGMFISEDLKFSPVFRVRILNYGKKIS